MLPSGNKKGWPLREPPFSYSEEGRYSSLQKSFPTEAEELYKAAEENAKWRYNTYKRLSKIEY